LSKMQLYQAGHITQTVDDRTVTDRRNYVTAVHVADWLPVEDSQRCDNNRCSQWAV